MNGLTMYRNVALLVLIALTSCVFGMPSKEEMHAAKTKCVAESGFDFSMFKNPSAMNESMNDPKLKCFGACMMKQFGTMNEDGTVNVEKGIELLPPDVPDREKVIEAIKECGTKKGENECETAAEIFKCFREKSVMPAMHHHHHHHHHDGSHE